MIDLLKKEVADAEQYVRLNEQNLSFFLSKDPFHPFEREMLGNINAGKKRTETALHSLLVYQFGLSDGDVQSIYDFIASAALPIQSITLKRDVKAGKYSAIHIDGQDFSVASNQPATALSNLVMAHLNSLVTAK